MNVLLNQRCEWLIGMGATGQLDCSVRSVECVFFLQQLFQSKNNQLNDILQKKYQAQLYSSRL